MASLNGFDASKVELARTYEPLPAGEYSAIITESEKKDTKAGTGAYLQLKIQVTEGKFQNRTLFDRLNLWNPNEVAVQIAEKTLSSICRAVEVLTPKDSNDLHGKRMRVKVAVVNDQNGNPRNEVKGYSQYTSEPAAVATDGEGSPF